MSNAQIAYAIGVLVGSLNGALLIPNVSTSEKIIVSILWALSGLLAAFLLKL